MEPVAESLPLPRHDQFKKNAIVEHTWVQAVTGYDPDAWATFRQPVLSADGFDVF